MDAARFFDFPPFHFETVRALWYAPSGGSDFAEVMTAVRQIKSRDITSWYSGWSRLAERIASQADQWADPLSAGNARLRASNYMRTAEFFLAPDAPQRREAGRFTQVQFFKGLETLAIPFERLRIPYNGCEMEAIYLPGDGDTLIVAHGGFDSIPEELFFVLGRDAQRRGCSVLLYEGPGQGQLLRKYGMPFSPDWHDAIGVAIDAALAKAPAKRVIGFGWSMGGHFLARAAAREKRLDGVILCDYFPAPIEAFKHSLPAFMRKGFVTKVPWVMWLVERKARSDAHLNWVLANARWTFGAKTLPELVDRMLAFDEGAWVEEIEAHVYIMTGEAEHFFDRAQADTFVSRLKSAKSVLHHSFSSRDGGELHCRNGAYHLLQDAVFQWLPQVTSAAASSGDKAVAAARRSTG